ncbi:MAG TPA: hypothetical protein VKP13_03455, partial [Nitrospira sp.]|nr:hypothetical protein [Nitrospira sp.]
MAGVLTRVVGCLTCVLLFGILLATQGAAAGSSGASPASGSGALPLNVKADRIDYLQGQEIYEADGSVIVDQGTLHLTAD